MNFNTSAGSTLVGLYLFSVPAFSYSEDLGLNKIPQILGVLVVVYALFNLIQVPLISKNRSVLFYFLFTLWSITTYAFAFYQSETGSLVTLLKVATITGGSAVLIKDGSDFRRTISIFFFSIFLTFLINRNDIMNLSQMNEITDNDRFEGTFANANTAALYCLGIIWVGFTLLLTGNFPVILRPLIIAGILLSVVIVIYSGSNKGLLGMGFFSAAVAWIMIQRYRFTRFKKFVFALVILGGTALIVNFIVTSPFFFRVQTMFTGDNESSVTRVFLFSEAIKVWSSSLKNILIGIGFDNFRFYNQLRDYSHSTITETLACTGLIGFVLYFSSFLCLFLTYLRSFNKQISGLKTTVILVFCFLCLILFFNSAAVMLDDRLFWPLLGVISGYGVVLGKQDECGRVLIAEH